MVITRSSLRTCAAYVEPEDTQKQGDNAAPDQPAVPSSPYPAPSTWQPATNPPAPRQPDERCHGDTTQRGEGFEEGEEEKSMVAALTVAEMIAPSDRTCKPGEAMGAGVGVLGGGRRTRPMTARLPAEGPRWNRQPSSPKIEQWNEDELDSWSEGMLQGSAGGGGHFRRVDDAPAAARGEHREREGGRVAAGLAERPAQRNVGRGTPRPPMAASARALKPQPVIPMAAPQPGQDARAVQLQMAERSSRPPPPARPATAGVRVPRSSVARSVSGAFGRCAAAVPGRPLQVGHATASSLSDGVEGSESTALQERVRPATAAVVRAHEMENKGRGEEGKKKVLVMARMSRNASEWCGGGWAPGGLAPPPGREKHPGPQSEPSLRHLSLSPAVTLSALGTAGTSGTDAASGDHFSREMKQDKGVKGKPSVLRPVYSAGPGTQRAPAVRPHTARALSSLAQPAQNCARHVPTWGMIPPRRHHVPIGMPGLQQMLERCTNRSKVFCASHAADALIADFDRGGGLSCF